MRYFNTKLKKYETLRNFEVLFANTEIKLTQYLIINYFICHPSTFSKVTDFQMYSA